jgi:ATP-dependent HslUV protease ATP-binding subunit HslU
LKEPENSLIKQYTQLLDTDDVDITFDESAITTIARLAFEVNETTENIGARRLHTIIEKALEDVLFEAPYGRREKKIITGEYIESKLTGMVKDRDLSKYIL